MKKLLWLLVLSILLVVAACQPQQNQAPSTATITVTQTKIVTTPPSTPTPAPSPATIHTPTATSTPTPTLTATPPTVYLSTPYVSGMTVTIGGVIIPNTITQMSWNWGDGLTNIGFFPQSHTYGSVGKYQVAITATDANGQRVSVTTAVTITSSTPTPTLASTPPTIYLSTASVSGMTATINGVTLPTTQGATITQLSWNWGDGEFTMGPFPQSHTYGSAGNYQVTVTAIDSNGQRASATTALSVFSWITPTPTPISPWVAVGPKHIAESIMQPIPGNFGAGKVNALSISANQSVIYAGSGVGPGNSGPLSDGGAFLTTDGGIHWHSIDNGLTDRHVCTMLMDPDDSNIALAGTWFSGIFRTTNSGSSWNQTSLDPTSSLLLVNGDVFAGAATGILLSKDFGKTWTLITTTESAARILASSSDGKTLYAGEDNGQIMKSTDGGTSWSNIFRFASNPIWSIAVSPNSSTTVYVVAGTPLGSIQDFWVSTDGGHTFSLLSAVPTSVKCIALDPSNPKVVFAMGDILSYKSTDGGISFTNMHLNLDVQKIVIDPSNNNIIYVGSDQGIYRSSDEGSTWKSLNDSISSSLLTAGSVSNDGKVFISAVQDYSPLVSFDGGNSWVVSSSAMGEDGQALINPSSNSHADLFTDSGFFYSSDGGRTFTHVNGLPSGMPGEGTPGPANNPNAVAVDPSHPNEVYVATSSGIYKSTDYGASFSLNSLKDHAIWAVAVKGNVMYAATTGAFWYSTDGGTNWTASSIPLQNVATIAIDPLNPSIVFAGNANGLYKSTDGGQLFSAINGLDLSNFIQPPCGGVGTIDIVGVNGQPYLFVGTEAGLFGSPDLGSTWENLTFNMNATEVTSIEYTSGNLYVTTYGEGFLEWPNFPITPAKTKS